MPLAMTLLKWLLVPLCFYAGVLALMYVMQRSLQYFPETARTPPAQAGLPQAEELTLDTADGERVIAWHVPASERRPVVLYFHGNGGSLRMRADRFRALSADGTGLVALSYRGYAGSTGSPTEAGLIADAEAAYRFARERYGADRIVLWGESLGTGVAVAIAAKHPVARVLLQSPFTSAADVGAAAYPFLPVHWLMKDPFYSDRRIGDVTAPVLVLHGAMDRVVPIASGERLYAMIRAPKRFARIERAGHNDHDAFGEMELVRGFISGE
jgi:fermentation-respiration switch protein FrsA (DUF1100 family)